MISSAKRMLSLAVLAALAALPASAEDLTIISTEKMGDRQSTSTQYLTAARARIAMGDKDSIVEYATGRMVQINHANKEYSETTLAEIDAAKDEFAAALEMIPGVARKLRSAGAVGQITVNKGAAARKIAGYDCTQYTLSMGDDLVFDLWVTPAFEMPPQLVDAGKAAFVMMGPSGRRFIAMYDEMKKIKGLWLAMGTRFKLAGKKGETHSEATEVKRDPIPASAFEVPVGYKKTKLPFQH